MKKLLLLGAVLIAVIATLSVGTWAYFSDTETATDNIIAAGTLNLKVGTTDGTVTAFNITDKKPGDEGNATTWEVKNIGTITGALKITVGAITNDENTRYSMETAAGDDSDVGGELGGLLKLAVWLDTDKDGKLDDGEKWLKAATATVETWAGGDDTTVDFAGAPTLYALVSAYDSDVYNSVASLGNNISAGNFRIEYYFPNAANSTDNKAQSDGIKVTLTFYIQQS